jgi:hypothetical protein
MSELQETEIVVDDSDFFGDEEIVILNGQRINRITGECVDTDDSISESDIHTKEDIATAFDVIMRINGFIEVTQRQLMNVGGRFEKSIRDRAERRDNLKAIYGAEIADKYGAETLDIALTDEWETPDLLSPDEIKAKQDALTKKKEDEFHNLYVHGVPEPEIEAHARIAFADDYEIIEKAQAAYTVKDGILYAERLVSMDEDILALKLSLDAKMKFMFGADVSLLEAKQTARNKYLSETEPILEAAAKAMLTTKRSCYFGETSASGAFRTVAMSININDDEGAVAWAKKHKPEAIVTSVDTKQLREDLKPPKKGEPKLKPSDIISFATVKDSYETFKFSTGIEAK